MDWRLSDEQAESHLSMGFSGQEHWSGLPRPPQMGWLLTTVFCREAGILVS